MCLFPTPTVAVHFPHAYAVVCSFVIAPFPRPRSVKYTCLRSHYMQTFQLQLVCRTVQGWLAGSCPTQDTSHMTGGKLGLNSQPWSYLCSWNGRFSILLKQPSFGLSRQGDSGNLLNWNSSACKYNVILSFFMSFCFFKRQTTTAGTNQISARNDITHYSSYVTGVKMKACTVNNKLSLHSFIL